MRWLVDHILSKWTEYVLPGDPPKGLAPFMITSFRSVIVLLFDSAQGKPMVVCKIARTTSTRLRLINDYETLLLLFKHCSDSFTRSLPRALEFFDIRGFGGVLVQTYIAGEQMTPGKKKLLNTHLGAVSSWLSHFHRESLEIPDRYLASTDIENPLIQRLAKDLDLFGEQSFWFQLVESRTTELLKFGTPLMWAHGDLNPTNVICQGNYIGVVDWDQASSSEIPLYDWFDFLFSYGYSLFRVSFGDARSCFKGFEQTFFSKNSLSKAIKEATHDYIENIGVDAEAVPAMFDIFIVRRVFPIWRYRLGNSLDLELPVQKLITRSRHVFTEL